MPKLAMVAVVFAMVLAGTACVPHATHHPAQLNGQCTLRTMNVALRPGDKAEPSPVTICRYDDDDDLETFATEPPDVGRRQLSASKSVTYIPLDEWKAPSSVQQFEAKQARAKTTDKP